MSKATKEKTDNLNKQSSENNSKKSISNTNKDLYNDFNQTTSGCTVEFRVPNGSLNEEIWQNYINFFAKFILDVSEFSRSPPAILITSITLVLFSIL